MRGGHVCGKPYFLFPLCSRRLNPSPLLPQLPWIGTLRHPHFLNLYGIYPVRFCKTSSILCRKLKIAFGTLTYLRRGCWMGDAKWLRSLWPSHRISLPRMRIPLLLDGSFTRLMALIDLCIIFDLVYKLTNVLELANETKSPYEDLQAILKSLS
jgi:hypothetical protein